MYELVPVSFLRGCVFRLKGMHSLETVRIGMLSQQIGVLHMLVRTVAHPLGGALNETVHESTRSTGITTSRVPSCTVQTLSSRPYHLAARG